MSNLKIFNEVKNVPNEYLKEIKGGRLSGMTDINPMWRIEKLTELYGICGFGWYYEITKQWIEKGHGEISSAFTNINLYIKDPNTGEWSKPIQGTGGSSFISDEKKGLYMSDECYKMALTDAISVACKSIGMGASVYYGQINTKYSKHTPNNNNNNNNNNNDFKCIECSKPFKPYTTKDGKTYSVEQMAKFAQNKNQDGKARCSDCAKALNLFVENKRS